LADSFVTLGLTVWNRQEINDAIKSLRQKTLENGGRPDRHLWCNAIATLGSNDLGIAAKQRPVASDIEILAK